MNEQDENNFILICKLGNIAIFITLFAFIIKLIFGLGE